MTLSSYTTHSLHTPVPIRRVLICNWQDELERRATSIVRRRGEFAAMILNDHSADRQSQSLSMSLRRDKRSKDAVPKWLLACSAAMPRDSPMQSSSAGSAQ